MIEFENVIYLDTQKTGSNQIREVLRSVLDEDVLYEKEHAPRAADSNKTVVISLRDPFWYYFSLWTYGLDGKGGIHREISRLKLEPYLYEKLEKDSFARWLRYVLIVAAPLRSSLNIGLLTHRYCMQALLKGRSALRGERYETLGAFYDYFDENKKYDFLVQTQSLTDDLRKAISCMKGVKLKPDWQSVFEEASVTKRNPSSLNTNIYNDFYDDALEALVVEKDALALLEMDPGDRRGEASRRKPALLDIGESIAAAHDFVEAFPEAAGFHVVLGALLSREGDAAGAEEALRRALELDADHAVGHYELSILLAEQGWLEEAEAEVAAACAILPDDSDLAVHHGRVLARMSRKTEAIERLRKVTELKPHNPRYLQELGDVLIDAGALDDAKAALQQALALDSDYLPAIADLARLSSLKGDHDRAVQMASRAVAQNPCNARLVYGLSLAKVAAGKLAPAISDARRAVVLRPGNQLYTEHLTRLISREEMAVLAARFNGRFRREAARGDAQQKEINRLRQRTIRAEATLDQERERGQKLSAELTKLHKEKGTLRQEINTLRGETEKLRREGQEISNRMHGLGRRIDRTLSYRLWQLIRPLVRR